ncbi:MAG: outer membrane beta-barrel protein [Pseudomonadota bacterium]
MKTKKSLILCLAIPVFSLLCFSTPALCAGKIVLRPKLDVSWQTDSNFFKAETGERSVDTYLVQPGAVLGYETDKSMVLLDYTMNVYSYDDRDNVPAGQPAADDDDYVGHTLMFTARTQPYDKLVLGLDNSYYYTRDPAQSDRFSDSVSRYKYSINRLTPLLFYESDGRFSAGLRYRNTVTNYTEGPAEDSVENRGMLDLIYNFSDTASVDLEYQYWAKNYDGTTSDYTSNQIALILKKQFQYFIVEVGGGYQAREFDDPAVEDIDTPAFRIALTGQNPPAPEADPKSRVSLTAEQNLNDSGTGDSYYTATRVTLEAGHVFLEKIPVRVSAWYQNSDYERTVGLTPSGTRELRDDDTTDLELEVGYMFTDCLTFFALAGYEERDSNLAGYSYDNSYFMLRLAFDYDMGGK